MLDIDHLDFEDTYTITRRTADFLQRPGSDIEDIPLSWRDGTGYFHRELERGNILLIEHIWVLEEYWRKGVTKCILLNALFDAPNYNPGFSFV